MQYQQIHNKKELKENRNTLRKNLTPAEATLWIMLKEKHLGGRKFRRQHSVGDYILDFYCPAEKLAIELDGEGHFNDEQKKYDDKRTEYLNSIGIRVVRFENEEVFQSPEGVLAEIGRYFKNRCSAE